MDVQPLTLVELVDDATDINNFASNDPQAQAVSNQVNRTIGGANTVVKLIIQKLGMRQEVVTLQALNVVEVCVKNCGSRFHNEIGKYKFINELIKLLSSKYDGDITPQRVKDRVINLMYSWYVGLPHEVKIGEAYKMLKQQGIIKRDPVDPNRQGNQPLPRDKENTAFHDENNTKLLKTLLSSKDAEDLHSANKLIKNMVKEEEERLDRVSKRIQVLETVANNVKLLDDMIGKYDSKVNESSLEIMNDLYERCLTLRPELFRLASKNVDDQDDSVGEILAASDELTRVIDSYKERVLFKKPDDETGSKSASDQLGTSVSSSNAMCLLDLDLNSPSSETSDQIKNSLLDEQFKLLGLSTPVDQTANPMTQGEIPGLPAMQGNWNANSNGIQGVMNPVQPMFSALPSSSNMLPNSSVSMIRPSHTMPMFNHMPAVANPVNVVRPVVVPPVSTVPPKKDILDFDVFDSDFLKPSPSSNGNKASSDTTSASIPCTSKKVEDTSADQLLSLTPPSADMDLPPLIAPTTTQTIPVTGTIPLAPTGLVGHEPLVPAPLLEPEVSAPIATPAPSQLPVLSTPSPVTVSTPAPEPVAVPVLAAAPVPTATPVPAATPVPSTTSVPSTTTVPASVPIAAVAPVSVPPVDATLTPSSIPTPIPPQVTNAVAQPASPVNYMVPLDALKTGTHPPIPILDKDGVKTFLMLAEDTRDVANPNVIVSILSTISLNTNPLSAFTIQVAVPKIMRVKLQPPTSTELAAYNPLAAPPSISQVMLIANPTKETVKLRFKVVYTLGGNSYVETANIEQLPVR